MESEDDLIGRATALGRAGHVRQAAHMLRERLRLDPHDTAIRGALAGVYRDAGHPDQAARYVFGVGAYDAREAEPYLQWLAGTGADEARIRQLSVLPDDLALPDLALSRLEEIRSADASHQPWEAMGWVGGGLFFFGALITLIVVYFAVLLGGNFALNIARIGGVLCIASLALGSTGIAGSLWKGGSRQAALIWGAIAVLLSALCAAALAALLT